MASRVYFYGYLQEKTWETMELLMAASGGSYQHNLSPGKTGFVFPNHIPSGIPTLLVVAELPYATATYDHLTKTVHWRLTHKADVLDERTLDMDTKPTQHPLWEKVLAGQCGVVKSAHHLMDLQRQGIPVDL